MKFQEVDGRRKTTFGNIRKEWKSRVSVCLENFCKPINTYPQYPHR